VGDFLKEKTQAGSELSIVSAWEREIDQLVYQLYGLTKEEIEIVEAAGK
jgi:hypothetical protein